MFGKIAMMNPIGFRGGRLLFQPLLLSRARRRRPSHRLLHRPLSTHIPPLDDGEGGENENLSPPRPPSIKIPNNTHTITTTRTLEGREGRGDSITALTPESLILTSLEKDRAFSPSPSVPSSSSNSYDNNTYSWEELLQEKERMVQLLSSSSNSLPPKKENSPFPLDSRVSSPQPSASHLLALLIAFREHAGGTRQPSSRPSSSASSSRHNHRRQLPRDTFAAQGNLGAALHADSLLQALEKWADSAELQDNVAEHEAEMPCHDSEIKSDPTGEALLPSAAMYQLVMRACVLAAGSNKPEEKSRAAQTAQAILERMLHRCRLARDHPVGPTTLRKTRWPVEPDSQHLATVIHAWATSRRPDAGQRAEEVHRLMTAWTRECAKQPPTAASACPTSTLPAVGLPTQQRHGAGGSGGPVPYRGCQPDEKTLLALMEAWTESRHPGATERAFILLTEALTPAPVDRFAYNGAIRPSVVLFNGAIKACVESGQGRPAALRAEEIMNLLVQTQAQQTDARRAAELQPNTLTYSLVVDAWAKCEAMEGSGEAAARAEGILRHMLDLYRRGVDVKPNVVTFTSCLAAWARSHAPDAVDRAEELWEWLLALYRETKDPDFRPDVQGASVIISAWARRVDRKESYERMMSIFATTKELLTPSMVTYTTVLDGLGRRGMIQEAIELLSWMEDHMKPNVISYSTVLAALARAGQAERAQWLVDRMKDRGVPPTTVTMNTLIDAWSRSDDPNKASRAERILRTMLTSYLEGDSTMKPDVVTFISCISAWSRCSSHDSFDRACRLWDLLVAMYRKTGDQDLRPDVKAATSLISVWGRNFNGQGSHKRMLAILEESKEFVTPNTSTYNTILDGLGRRGMVKEAMELLAWLEDHMKPDLISYNCIVAALARRGQGADAERVLERMKERALTPDKITMNTLMSAWAHSNDQGRASRAQHVLHCMLKRYRDGEYTMKPDRLTFTSMMKACQPTTESTREERQRALEVAMETYRLFREGLFGNLDEQAYFSCIRAMQGLVEDEQQRSNLLLSVFRDCQDNGHVSERVLNYIGKLRPEWIDPS